MQFPDIRGEKSCISICDKGQGHSVRDASPPKCFKLGKIKILHIPNHQLALQSSSVRLISPATPLLALVRHPQSALLMIMAPRATIRAKKEFQLSRPSDTPLVESRWFEVVRMAIRPIGLLVLAAVSSPISQLGLSPVYGSVPASVYHQGLVTTAFLLAVSTQAFSRHYAAVLVGLRPMSSLAPILLTAQNILTRKSASFGPSLGPIVTELCTYFPMLYLSLLSTVVGLCALRIGNHSNWIKTSAATAISYTIFIAFQKISRNMIDQNIGKSLIFTRSGLQYVVAILYTLALPSRPALLAWIVLLYPLSKNYHLPFQRNQDMLNQVLHDQGFSLVARQESFTGYISVLENVDEGFRAMRCDHSLLGGEWIDRQGASRSRLGEPIYSCFVMLEAVRLVESSTVEARASKSDTEKQALVM